MCAKVAGPVLRVLSDLLGHENHEVLSAARPAPGLGRAGPGSLLPPLPHTFESTTSKLSQLLNSGAQRLEPVLTPD